MITVRNAEFLISFMTFFLAYAIATTIAGAFRAFVAKKMGDDTAEDAGFLSLNPLIHIDLVGTVFLLIFYFGWGRYVPINPSNIHGIYRRYKILIAYLSDTFAYFISALVSIILLIIVLGPRMLLIAQQMLICAQNMSHLYLIHACPTMSSLAVTLSFIVISFVYFNVLLFVLSLILNVFILMSYFMMERSTHYFTYNYYLIFLIPIIFILLFSQPLRLLAIYVISVVGYSISCLLGMI
jgi:hypothetical protein